LNAAIVEISSKTERAESAAQTAESAREDAQTSKESAETAANNALSSANAAKGFKNDAESASARASASAEEAKASQTAAENAKNKAENARYEAKGYAESAAGTLANAATKAELQAEVNRATAAEETNATAIDETGKALGTEVERAKTAEQNLANEVSEVGNKVDTVVGGDTGKSARTIAAEEVAKVVANAPADLDTLKEIADYIASDKTDAAQMVTQIDTNAKAISAEEKRAQDAEAALAGRVKELEEKPSVKVDDKLSLTSENPVQNKVVAAALAEKANKEDIPEIPPPPDLSGYVMKDGDETITGEKTFTGGFRVTNSDTLEEGDSGYLDVIFSEYEGCNITTCSPFVVKSYDGDSWDEVLGGYDCGSSIIMTPWDFEIATNLSRIFASEDGSLNMSSVGGIYLSAPDANLNIIPGSVELMNTYYFSYGCVTTLGDINLSSDAISLYNPEYGEYDSRPTGARLFLDYDAKSASLISSDYEWTDEYETEYTESGYAFDVNYDGTYTFRNIADDESAVTFTLEDFRTAKNAMPRYRFNDGGIDSDEKGFVAYAIPFNNIIFPCAELPVEFRMEVMEDVVDNVARDCIVTLDCRDSTDEPTIIWGNHFHPRTDAATDFACVAGKRNVYWITEHAPGEFCVAGWQETEGGNAE
jgi:hypothetical protein